MPKIINMKLSQILQARSFASNNFILTKFLGMEKEQSNAIHSLLGTI